MKRKNTWALLMIAALGLPQIGFAWGIEVYLFNSRRWSEMYPGEEEFR